MTREMSLHIYSLESKHYNDVLIGSMVTVNNRKLKMKPLAGWRQRSENSRLLPIDDESLLPSLMKVFVG